MSLRTSGEVASSPPTSSAGPQTTFSTPGGIPARTASSPSASADSGVAGAGLTTIVQPAASAGAALRAIIAIGKFHGVIAAHDADRLAQREQPATVGRGRDDLAVRALGLLGVPLDEGGAVEDLPARLGERLALLRGEHHREVVDVLDDQVVPGAQDGRARLRRRRRPGRRARRRRRRSRAARPPACRARRGRSRGGWPDRARRRARRRCRPPTLRRSGAARAAALRSARGRAKAVGTSAIPERAGQRRAGLPRFAYRALDRNTSSPVTTTSLQSLNDVDRRHVFHPFSVLSRHETSGPRRMIVSGRGSTLTDDQGRSYLDAMAGLWCVNVGYGRVEIADALRAQALKLPYYHSFSSMATDTPALLAERLIALAPERHVEGALRQQRLGRQRHPGQARAGCTTTCSGARGRRRSSRARAATTASSLASASLTGLAGMHTAFDLPLPDDPARPRALPAVGGATRARTTPPSAVGWRRSWTS